MDAYTDRNLAVQLMARLAATLDWEYGIGIDPGEPEWPVLYIDLPTGQVSWHLPKADIVGEWPRYHNSWDGHTTEEKRKRIERLLETGLFG